MSVHVASNTAILPILLGFSFRRIALVSVQQVNLVMFLAGIY